MRAPLESAVVAVVVAGILSGCASPAVSVEPTVPAIPDGWNEVTSDPGDVRLTLPADVPAIFTASGIMAQMPLTDGAIQLEVLAVGPGDVHPQPDSGEDLGSWLERSEWVPRAGEPGYVVVTPAVVNEVELAAGRALEADVTLDPGLPNAVRVVVYAIQTGEGIAIIRLVGNPRLMEERAGDLRLIAMFAEFRDL